MFSHRIAGNKFLPFRCLCEVYVRACLPLLILVDFIIGSRSQVVLVWLFHPTVGIGPGRVKREFQRSGTDSCRQLMKRCLFGAGGNLHGHQMILSGSWEEDGGESGNARDLDSESIIVTGAEEAVRRFSAR